MYPCNMRKPKRNSGRKQTRRAVDDADICSICEVAPTKGYRTRLAEEEEERRTQKKKSKEDVKNTVVDHYGNHVRSKKKSEPEKKVVDHHNCKMRSKKNKKPKLEMTVPNCCSFKKGKEKKKLMKMENQVCYCCYSSDIETSTCCGHDLNEDECCSQQRDRKDNCLQSCNASSNELNTFRRHFSGSVPKVKLALGDEGQEVQKLQSHLVELGFLSTDCLDSYGFYGLRTANAVEDFRHTFAVFGRGDKKVYNRSTAIALREIVRAMRNN